MHACIYIYTYIYIYIYIYKRIYISRRMDPGRGHPSNATDLLKAAKAQGLNPRRLQKDTSRTQMVGRVGPLTGLLLRNLPRGSKVVPFWL